MIEINLDKISPQGSQHNITIYDKTDGKYLQIENDTDEDMIILHQKEVKQLQAIIKKHYS
jgi:hypothetical protein